MVKELHKEALCLQLKVYFGFTTGVLGRKLQDLMLLDHSLHSSGVGKPNQFSLEL